ncbi:MAG: DUF6273 domain-containing protein, partial [Oscillospiraceae bacterium]|nr:DUF6273 domain-containing protein [Oscillospiraceae bacterium]
MRAYNNEYKATNWKNCTLQKYLNEEFYKTIDEAHRNKIQVTKNAPL